MEMNNDIFTPDLPIPEPVGFEDSAIPAPAEEEKPAETHPPRRRRKADAPVLTIESGDEIETEDVREAAAWHEIHNAYRTRRILSAPLGGIEQTDSGKTIAVVDYNGFRIVIPLKEMMVAPSAANSGDSMAVRQMKLLGNMLGAEIDFVILGIDSKSRSVVASRREAMMRKRQLFYFSPDANGEYRVREGRVVQARVIAVADKSIPSFIPVGNPAPPIPTIPAAFTMSSLEASSGTSIGTNSSGCSSAGSMMILSSVISATLP